MIYGWHIFTDLYRASRRIYIHYVYAVKVR